MNKVIYTPIKHLVLLQLLILLSCTYAAGANRVYLDITAPETRKINMAVPWFTSKNPADQSRHPNYPAQQVTFRYLYREKGELPAESTLGKVRGLRQTEGPAF